MAYYDEYEEYDEYEGFSIKDIGKPFKTVAQKIAPVGKTVAQKIAPVGKTIGKGVVTAGKSVGTVGKTIGTVGKGVFGGIANFFKNIWKWLRWAFYIIVVLLVIKFGAPVFRFVSGMFRKRE
jgi:hypothetical protein